MLEHRIVIRNKRGLHARAASRLVAVASRYGCDVRVCTDDKEADGKNIMSVMMLAASPGTEILLRAEGDCANAAMAAIIELIENRFDEEE